MNKNNLGNTAISVSRAGFGVLALGKSHRALSDEEGSELLLYSLGRGIDFFDTAQYYHENSMMKAFVKKAQAQGYAREDYVICSKSLARDYASMTQAVDEALRGMGLECIDVFLMHEVRTGQLDERAGAWRALMDAKAAGKVRAIGLSTHHTDVAAAAAELEGCDCVFALLNIEAMGIRTGEAGGPGGKLPGYWLDDRPGTREEMEAALEKCHEAGLGVFTFKALGGGNLTASYTEALKYAFSRPFTDSVMVGMSSEREVDELLALVDGDLGEDFTPDVSGKRLTINHEDCVGCGSCMKACASQAISYAGDGLAEIDPIKCINCGYCAYACPVRAVIRV